MIKFYLVSIVIWAIMIYGTAYIFGDKIRENGWLDAPKSKKNPYVLALLSAAIPVIRLLYFLSVIVMVGFKKEEFDEWMDELQDGPN